MTAGVDNPISSMMSQLEASSDFISRRSAVDSFNAANRWKKRGISMVPMRYDHNLGLWTGLKYNCLISIYGADGSVAVSHNGKIFH